MPKQHSGPGTRTSFHDTVIACHQLVVLTDVLRNDWPNLCTTCLKLHIQLGMPKDDAAKQPVMDETTVKTT